MTTNGSTSRLHYDKECCIKHNTRYYFRVKKDYWLGAWDQEEERPESETGLSYVMWKDKKEKRHSLDSHIARNVAPSKVLDCCLS